MIRINKLPMAMLLIGMAFAAQAQDFPTKPIRIIVPYSPGGQADLLSRLVGKYVTQSTGQIVNVDNRPGAAGMVGAGVMANAAADGYTIAMFSTPHASTPAVVKLPFDMRQLRPITMVGITPNIISVNAASPYRSLDDVLSNARANPGKMTYGHSGNLASSHLTMELLKVSAKVDIVPVPYKGGAQALGDLLGGQIDLSLSSPGGLMGHLKSGKLRAIATTGPKRSGSLPEVATVAESSIPGFESYEWFALFAPDKTPPDVIARLHKEVVKAIAEPEVRNTAATTGVELVGNSPAELGTFFHTEMDRLAKLISTLNLKAD